MPSSSSAGTIAPEVVRRLEASFPEGAALHEPEFDGNEASYVLDCVQTGWVSSAGAYVDRFERMLEEYTGAGRAVAVVNGTAALHLAFVLAGVEADDEVLVPALTFVATANAVRYCGAHPHFVDAAVETLGLDPHKLDAYLASIAEHRGSAGCWNRATGRRIAACVPMHTFGHAVELDALLDVCRRWGIALVEDAAESLGTTYKGRHTGTLGVMGTLSFNGNKIVTTGGGGAILTNDPDLGRRLKHVSSTAKVPHAWEYIHDEVGYNYRMPNLNAALGCAQLERLDDMLARKRSLARHYQEMFSDLDGVSVFTGGRHSESNFWLNVLLLDGEDPDTRDEILRLAHEVGLQLRPAWRLMPDLPMYADCPTMDLSVSRSVAARLVNLPSGASLRPA